MTTTTRIATAAVPAASAAAVVDARKQAAARAAAKLISDHDRVGFGTGSTAKHFTAAIGLAVETGKLVDVTGTPTSEATRLQAEKSGIKLTAWDDHGALDHVVDGADQVVLSKEGETFVIKGGGGAMLRERAVANRALEHGGEYTLIVDDSKVVDKLTFPLPIETAEANVDAESAFLTKLGGSAVRRVKDGKPFVTDNGNAIIDVTFEGGIADPKALQTALNKRLVSSGGNVAAHGLFNNMADRVLVGGERGVTALSVVKPKAEAPAVVVERAIQKALLGLNPAAVREAFFGDLARDLAAMFTLLRKMEPGVTFLGSARTHPGDAAYEGAVALGAAFAPRAGESVDDVVPLRSGIGPAQMEAPLKGLKDALQAMHIGDKDGAVRALTQGFAIQLEHEQSITPYVDEFEVIRQFAMRMFGIFENSLATVTTEGGFGTFAEMFAIWAMDMGDPMFVKNTAFYGPVFAAIEKGARQDRELISDARWAVPTLTDDNELIVSTAKALKKAGKPGFTEAPEIMAERIRTDLVAVDNVLQAMPKSQVLFLGSKSLDKNDRTVTTLTEVAKLLGERGYSGRVGSSQVVGNAVAAAMKAAHAPTVQAIVREQDGLKARAHLNIAATVHDITPHQVGLMSDVRGLVIAPGGVETLAQLFGFLTDLQTGKAAKVPVVLLGKSYWEPIIDAIKVAVLDGPVKMINPDDMKLFHITDDAGDAAKLFPPLNAKETVRAAHTVRIDTAAGTSKVQQNRLVTGMLEGIKAQMTMVQAAGILGEVRRAPRELTVVERELVDAALELVASGEQIPWVHQSENVKNNGYRDHITQISLADVGEGHLDITTKDIALLDGLILHHEHIDRENTSVAAYRAVRSAINAKLNLVVGTDAAVTAYYGRGNFQPDINLDGADVVKDLGKWFDTDATTAINDTAAYASEMFSNGTADVKIAMDMLSATQAIHYMKGITIAAERRPDQSLSAAFNLNRAFIDDRPDTLANNGAQARVLNPVVAGVNGAEPTFDKAIMRDIALLSVEIAAAGGFEKVTLDSATKAPPSPPLTEHLGMSTLMEWTHKAHSSGLETYISGGMRDRHFPDAVYSGVGGVGVGTSMHKKLALGDGKFAAGPLDPEIIRTTMKARNDAEASTRGVGGRLQAQLDRQFDAAVKAHVRLPDAVAALREALFAELNSYQPKAEVLDGKNITTFVYGGDEAKVQAFIATGKQLGFLGDAAPALAGV